MTRWLSHMDPKAHLIAPKASKVIAWHSFQMTQNTNRKAIYLTSILHIPISHLLFTHTHTYREICITSFQCLSLQFPWLLRWEYFELQTNIGTWQHTNDKLNANYSIYVCVCFCVCRDVSTADEYCVTSGNDAIAIEKIKIDRHAQNHWCRECHDLKINCSKKKKKRIENVESFLKLEMDNIWFCLFWMSFIPCG